MLVGIGELAFALAGGGASDCKPNWSSCSESALDSELLPLWSEAMDSTNTGPSIIAQTGASVGPACFSPTFLQLMC